MTSSDPEPDERARFAALTADVRRLQRKLFDHLCTGDDLVKLRALEDRLDRSVFYVRSRRAGELLADANRVARMRETQQLFVRGVRDPGTIRLARALERDVDDALRDFLTPAQPELPFGDRAKAPSPPQPHRRGSFNS